jgi:tetratricopeptide (TPR) repeat protein
MASQPARAAGAFAKAVTLPSGKTTPYEEQFSHEESLAARGDVPAALEAFEQVIAQRPTAVAPRMRAAELYAARGANPARAAELFREIRAIAGVTNRDAVYACSRLVDLYDGALDEPGRAVVELRRIIELYPGTPLAAHARNALPRLKARLNDATATPD